MRRQAASPRFLLWAFWGHSLVQPPHQEGSPFRERVPRIEKTWRGGFADPLKWFAKCSVTGKEISPQIRKDTWKRPNPKEPQLQDRPCATVRPGRILLC